MIVPLPFGHPDLDADDPTKRLSAIELAIERLEIHQRQLNLLHQRIQNDINTLSAKEAGFDVRIEDRVNDLRVAFRQVENGVTAWDGVQEGLDDIVGLPGLRTTRALLKDLAMMRHEAEAEIATATQPPARYRLKKGMRHAMPMSGGLVRICREGDIVELNASQANAWRDKFVRVEDEPPSPPKAPLTVPEGLPPGPKHPTQARYERRAQRESR